MSKKLPLERRKKKRRKKKEKNPECELLSLSLGPPRSESSLKMGQLEQQVRSLMINLKEERAARASLVDDNTFLERQVLLSASSELATKKRQGVKKEDGSLHFSF